MFGIQFGKSEDPAVVSYRTMRRMIGYLGMALPVILFVWSVLITQSHFLLDSISSYYSTNMRDIFVGILCAVAFFLFTYHGYDKYDFVAFKIASLSALGVAFNPSFIKSPINPYVHIPPNVSGLTNAVHYISAAIFFTTLAVVSLFLFTKTGPGKNKIKAVGRKRTRNQVYRICGLVIFACILCMLIIGFLPDDAPFLRWDPVFWVETIALFAFATSWLVKGELILADQTA
ncbi:MAG: DUF998 domain-containing protein [Spirochaetes bacterium]|nr:DUF998 domain-containing protein [Spirochaetota bacterium]MBU0954132.1 DUF998 domain-containing protein [Spirochaetota bacterium]